jgi:hypothetical protein
MYAQRLERRPRNQAGVMALVASVVAALLLAVSCGQSVPAAQPLPSGGGGSAQLEP